MKYAYGDTYRATFAPKDLSTLRPDLHALIGSVLTLHFAWMQDAGPYAGQPVFTRCGDPYPWIPLEDLDGLEIVVA